MGAFGERLRREREMRGVSLDEIAQATKIGTRLLRALEEEQFDLLPGGIFNKGFVRAYAKYLGINEEQAVVDYMQAAGETEPEFREFAQTQADIYSRGASENSGNRGFPLLPVLILLMIVAAGFGGWKLYQQHVRDRESSSSSAAAQASSSSSTSTQTAAPAGNQSDSQQTVNPSNQATGTVQTVAPTESSTPAVVQSPSEQVQPQSASSTALAPGKNFQIVLHTTGPAWVSIKADGRIAVRGIVPASETKTIQANEEIIVWTGNAGVTQVSFNGTPVPITGGANEVKLLVFRQNGLQPPPPPKKPVSTEPSRQRSQETSNPPQ